MLGGGIAFNSKVGCADRPLELPCGQCLSCRMVRTRDWGIRGYHESQMHPKSCFLTLTYNDINLPFDHSVDVDHWQRFAKKVRKRLGPFRYLHCGEYGDDNHRPHYHALCFGIDFAHDRVPIPGTKNPAWNSPSLNALWGYGFTQISDVTFSSAAYVAGYCIKKVNGRLAEDHYTRVCPHSGETWKVKPDYATMSRRPGLATSWFNKYSSEVYPDDFVVINGKKLRPPKFYDKRLQNDNPELWKDVQNKRKQHSQTPDQQWNNSEERLRIRETVAEATKKHRGNRTL